MVNTYVADTGGLDGHTFDRQAVGQILGSVVTHTTGAQVRGGVVPANGNPLGYVATTGLSASFKAGTYIIAVPDANLGPLKIVHAADETWTHATQHATQPRSDLIIAKLVDNGDGTSTATFDILPGTAGSGAPDPTLPSSLGNGAVVALHRVLVPAASSGSSLSTITDLRTYTVGAGGVVPVASWTLGAALPVGTAFYATDTQSVGVVKTAGARPPGPDPVVYSSTETATASPAFTNTTAQVYGTVAYTFTPTRTGWAWVTCKWDAETVTSGWGAAVLGIEVAGVLVDWTPIMLEAQSRNLGRFTSAKPVLLQSGVSVTINLQVNRVVSAGSWKLNSGFQWIVTEL